jgi:hypothetical protein
MGNSTKACILLFLIFVLIYLLMQSNQSEYLTSLNVPSQQEVSTIVDNFDNNKGFTPSEASGTTKNQANSGLIAPLTGGNTADILNAPSIDYSTKEPVTNDPKMFQDEMTGMGPQNLDNASLNYYSNQLSNSLSQKDFSANDFLPQEINSDWFNTDITKAQSEIDQSTLIDVAKFCQGVDTIGQSLKNPSYDIRGNIPNPKITVSPFLNSSYDPDTNIKSWC